MRTPQAVLCLVVLLALGSTACHSSGGSSGGSSGVVIDPPAAEASPGATLQFAATAAASPQIVWSVVEANGGTIDATGFYTAPLGEGTFHVVATATAGGAQQTASVTVRQGGPSASTTPPSDGTTPWAPAASDSSWADVRAFGAVGDGVSDDTAAFRSAAATGKNLFVPAPPVAYKLTGVVQVRSSVYGDGSMPEIRMSGSNGDPDQGTAHNILLVQGYQGAGLVIQGLHLNGQWDGGTNGEWAHGVNITQSSNVTVQYCNIEGAYGDDVFVGSFSTTVSNNVVVQNNTLSNPRRCNVAVNNATNVVIRGNRVVKTGTYVSAIDLEPDPLGYQFVRGVRIDGNVFNVVAQDYGAGAVSMNNPAGNPSSGDVSVTNNHGTWVPTYSYMDVVSGSGGLVGIVPHLSW